MNTLDAHDPDFDHGTDHGIDPVARPDDDGDSDDRMRLKPGAKSGDFPATPFPGDAAVRTIGRYVVEKRLGRGGMGEVLKARDPASDVDVAIKVLDAEGYQDDELLRRFEREARAVSEVLHPNLGRIFGMERDARGLPFIVMEFIDGLPLDKVLRANPDLSFARSLHFAIQTARGLDAARRRSLIHRDIKPANLLVMDDDTLKVIDFGLAKSLWEKSVLTMTGMVVGTPRYLSPEQGLGRTSIDHRSDIYSLGATLYELVTRQAPFEGDTPAAIMLKHVNSPLVPPYLINPKVPVEMSECICRMMAKDPRDRYQEYDDLIIDLEGLRQTALAKERRLSAADPAGAMARDSAWGGAGTGAGVVPDYPPTAPAPRRPVSNATAEFAGAGDRPWENSSESPAAPPFGGMASAPQPRPKPSPYLTEGLVHVKFDAPADEKPRGSAIMYSVIGGVILLVALVFGLIPRRPSADAPPDAKPKSWLATMIGKAAGKDAPPKEETPDDLAAADEAKIDVTRGRMGAAVVKLLRYRDQKLGGTGVPKIRDMRRDGAVTEEDSTDAWGNDFVTVADGSQVTVVSAGRDGRDDTDDDFRFSLDGAVRKVPPALTAEDFAKKGKRTR